MLTLASNCATLGCVPLQPNTKLAHCGVCHRTFTTVGNFDRHRVGLQCVDPIRVGMAPLAHGYWGMPNPEPERSHSLTW